MLDEVFNALAEPRRREILQLVRDQELSSGDIAARFEVTRPAISQHLRVLENTQLVVVRQEGTRRLYRARPEGLRILYEFIDSFWSTGLDQLKEAIEEDYTDGDGGD